MTLQIPLSPEMEARLREQAKAAGKDLTSFVLEAVEEKVAGANGSACPVLSRQQWSREWHEWATSHRRLGQVVDDSRQSIYAGRGE